jgi:hypothetical protein
MCGCRQKRRASLIEARRSAFSAPFDGRVVEPVLGGMGCTVSAQAVIQAESRPENRAGPSAAVTRLPQGLVSGADKQILPNRTN